MFIIAAFSDDLSDLLLGQGPPGGVLRYSQATVITWNPDDFTGTLDWRGITLTNVPVLASIQALGFQPGDVVGMLGWQPQGGLGSWWIIGKLAVPGVDSPDLVIRGSDLIIDGGTLIIEGGGSQIIRDGGNLDVLGGGDINVDGGAINVDSTDGVIVSGGGDILIDSGGSILVENGGDILVDDNGEIRVTSTSFDREVALLNGGLALYNPTTANLRANFFYDEVNGGFQLNSDESVFFSTDGTSFTHTFDSASTSLRHSSGSAFGDAGWIANELIEDTSSAKYKVDITDYMPDTRKIFDLRPRTWRDKKDVEEHPDSDRWWVGYIAEELDELELTDVINYDEHGDPANISYKHLVVPLVEIVKEQRIRIEAIEQALGIAPSEEKATPTHIPKRLRPIERTTSASSD